MFGDELVRPVSKSSSNRVWIRPLETRGTSVLRRFVREARRA